MKNNALATTVLVLSMSVSLSVLMSGAAAQAQTWRALGPPGGDVHSLAADPSRPGRLFLGTADGHIFASEDGGTHWELLGRAGERQDAVITAIVVDPHDEKVLFASEWTQDPAAGGGVFRSDDGGVHWHASGLPGQAVRALVMAPSDANVLVAGTLDGVYRSRNAAKTWERISPAHEDELRNFDSLAVDPRNADIIYAGTFHLPWKTTDGGRNWRPIHEGMIDDSDVMSFLVDRANPTRIYASACSGIYRSDNGATQWKKIQGIPYTARRTYVITQDPRNPALVYAATSEGLWKTDDAGVSWRRTTPQDWVVNTVVVPAGQPGRVVIGTEQLGVLTSDDEGDHFRDANDGFFHRQILALALDTAHPGRLLAVLANSPEPVLVTDDTGRSWAPLGPGLSSEQALRVYAAPGGEWLAALAHGGLMRYDVKKDSWQRTGTVTGGKMPIPAAPANPHPRARSGSRPRPRTSSPQLEEVVHDMAFDSHRWFAATDNGLLVSSDRGSTWTVDQVGPLDTLPVQSVRVSKNGERLWVVSLRGLVFSSDGGKTWSWHDLPLNSGGAVTLDMDPADESTLACIAHNGLYLSRDGGNTWQQAAAGLPSTPVQDLAISGNVFLASMSTGGLYLSSDSGRTWTRMTGMLADNFFSAVTTKNGLGVVFAASANDGLYAVELSGAVASAPAPHVVSGK